MVFPVQWKLYDQAKELWSSLDQRSLEVVYMVDIGSEITTLSGMT